MRACEIVIMKEIHVWLPGQMLLEKEYFVKRVVEYLDMAWPNVEKKACLVAWPNGEEDMNTWLWLPGQ